MELHPILEKGDEPSCNLWYVLSASGAPSCRVGQACTFDADCCLYVIGGADPSTAFSDCFRFDMSHLNWKKLSDEKYNACYEHCAFLPDCDRQRVFMFGGATKTDNLNSVQTLSLSNGEVQKVDCTGTLPSPRTLHSSAWYGDVLYVWGGGKQGSEPVSDVQLHVFDAATKSWKQPTLKGKIPSARHGHAMLMHDKSIYIHGGMSGITFHKDLHQIKVTDYSCSKVQSKGDVPSARAGHAACAFQQLIYIFGGLCPKGALDDMFQFNTMTSVWTKLKFDSPAPAPRLDHSMVFADFPVVAKAKVDVRNTDAQSSSNVGLDSNSTDHQHQTNIVPLDDWSSSVGRDVINEAGDQPAAILPMHDRQDVTFKVPVLLVFGGMDTSGNMFNDLMLLRLDS